MEKLDLTKKYKTYFTSKTKPEIVEIEPAHFISITGKGDPSEKSFSEKIQALYTSLYHQICVQTARQRFYGFKTGRTMVV